MDPSDPAIVASTIINGSNNAVTFASDEDDAATITGFTITDANTGIYCAGTSPTISSCVITGNKEFGIQLQFTAKPNITCCEISCNKGSGIAAANGDSSFNNPSINSSIIAANRLYGINCNMSEITNCTIAANGQEGVKGQWPTLSNSIVYYNNSDNGNVQIASSAPTISYSDVQGGWAGAGNISTDPCFAQVGFWDANETSEDISDDTCLAGDYHLLSQAGRWVPSHISESDPNVLVPGCWVMDQVTSSCIDAGDSYLSYGDELWPHGERINMGAYGGTLQASLSLSDAGDIRDINRNEIVDMNDVSLLLAKWNSDKAPSKEDLDLDGTVNANDLVFFENNWLADSNNIVPQFDAVEDVNVMVDDMISFSVSASDTDSDELEYIAAGLPDGASFAGQAFTWTPEQAGTYNVTFIASDKKSLTLVTVEIIVKPKSID